MAAVGMRVVSLRLFAFCLHQSFVSRHIRWFPGVLASLHGIRCMSCENDGSSQQQRVASWRSDGLTGIDEAAAAAEIE